MPLRNKTKSVCIECCLIKDNGCFDKKRLRCNMCAGYRPRRECEVCKEKKHPCVFYKDEKVCYRCEKSDHPGRQFSERYIDSVIDNLRGFMRRTKREEFVTQIVFNVGNQDD